MRHVRERVPPLLRLHLPPKRWVQWHVRVPEQYLLVLQLLHPSGYRRRVGAIETRRLSNATRSATPDAERCGY